MFNWSDAKQRKINFLVFQIIKYFIPNWTFGPLSIWRNSEKHLSLNVISHCAHMIAYRFDHDLVNGDRIWTQKNEFHAIGGRGGEGGAYVCRCVVLDIVVCWWLISWYWFIYFITLTRGRTSDWHRSRGSQSSSASSTRWLSAGCRSPWVCADPF